MSRPKLPLPLQGLVDQRAPARTQQMWHQIQARMGKRRSRSRDWLLLAAALAPLVVAVAWLGGVERWFAAPATGLRLANGAALPVHVEPRAGYAALDLSDGSRVTVAQHARLDVLETSGRAVSLALRHGRARFDVRPHGPRTWRVECGPLAVEVVGTAFVIERTAAALQVDVLRGAVLVRGESVPDGVQRLNGGQRLRVASGAVRAAAPAAAAPEAALARKADMPHLAPESALAAAQGPMPGSESAPAAPSARAAERETRAQASEPAPEVRAREHEPPRPRAGGAEPQRARVPKSGAIDVEALLREADALRLAGHVHAAVAALTRIIDTHPWDPRAGLAAFALARLHLGALADPQQAGRDLQRALALGLPLALQEDAYAKLVEAHDRAGDRLAACAALAQYARRFPSGSRFEDELRRCQVERDP